jgi:hypothetical protein
MPVSKCDGSCIDIGRLGSDRATGPDLDKMPLPEKHQLLADDESEMTQSKSAVRSRLVRLVGVGAGVAVLAAGCSSTPTDPNEAANCEDLIDVAVAQVGALGNASDETSGDGYVALLGDLRTDMAVVSNRAGALGCDTLSTSGGFRRSLIDADHETGWRTVLVLEAAMFDPFRDPASIGAGGTVSLAGDVAAGLDRLEELTATLASDYRNGGADPIDQVDIGSELAVAFAVTWRVDDESAFGGATEDLALLLMVDQGLFDPSEMPVGIAARQQWLDETTAEGETLDALLGAVWGSLSGSLNRTG